MCLILLNLLSLYLPLFISCSPLQQFSSSLWILPILSQPTLFTLKKTEKALPRNFIVVFSVTWRVHNVELCENKSREEKNSILLLLSGVDLILWWFFLCNVDETQIIMSYNWKICYLMSAEDSLQDEVIFCLKQSCMFLLFSWKDRFWYAESTGFALQNEVIGLFIGSF